MPTKKPNWRPSDQLWIRCRVSDLISSNFRKVPPISRSSNTVGQNVDTFRRQGIGGISLNTKQYTRLGIRVTSVSGFTSAIFISGSAEQIRLLIFISGVAIRKLVWLHSEAQHHFMHNEWLYECAKGSKRTDKFGRVSKSEELTKITCIYNQLSNLWVASSLAWRHLALRNAVLSIMARFTNVAIIIIIIIKYSREWEREREKSMPTSRRTDVFIKKSGWRRGEWLFESGRYSRIKQPFHATEQAKFLGIGFMLHYADLQVFPSPFHNFNFPMQSLSSQQVN